MRNNGVTADGPLRRRPWSRRRTRWRAFLDAASAILLETVHRQAPPDARRPTPDARRSALRWALSSETWFRLHRLEDLANDDAATLIPKLLVRPDPHRAPYRRLGQPAWLGHGRPEARATSVTGRITASATVATASCSADSRRTGAREAAGRCCDGMVPVRSDPFGIVWDPGLRASPRIHRCDR